MAVEEDIPAPFVIPFAPATPLFERDEGGAFGGVVMVLDRNVSVGYVVLAESGVCPGETVLDTPVKIGEVVTEDGAGPVTKGVGKGPVPVIEVGDTV